MYYIILAVIVLYFIFSKNPSTDKKTALIYLFGGIWGFASLMLVVELIPSLVSLIPFLSEYSEIIQGVFMLFALLVVFKTIGWLEYKMLRNEKISNSFIYAYLFVAVTFLMFFVGAALWAAMGFPWAIAGVLAAIIVWVLWMRKINNRITFRCKKCRKYPGQVSWVGNTADGIKEIRNHDVGSSKSARSLGDNEFEAEEVTLNTSTTEYYQMYRDHYHCRLCDHRWSVRYTGEKVGENVRQKKRTETTRYRE